MAPEAGLEMQPPASDSSDQTANSSGHKRAFKALIINSSHFIAPLSPLALVAAASDLSYNRIHGSLDRNLTGQPNLIDLYLGHNQIECLAQDAFLGLNKLQVLELENNNLKQIHPLAFLPIGKTLVELNLANNRQLRELKALGLDQLVSFKAFGNEQLRELPHFKSASYLALTYAYHCCDYLKHNGNNPQQWDYSQEETSTSGQSLVVQLLHSIWATFGADQRRSLADLGGNERRLIGRADDNDDTTNLTDLVVWPQFKPSHADATKEVREEVNFKPEAAAKQNAELDGDQDRDGELAFGGQTFGGNLRKESVGAGRRPRFVGSNNGRLIDERALQVEQIRVAHLVGGLNKISSRKPQEPTTIRLAHQMEAGRLGPDLLAEISPIMDATLKESGSDALKMDLQRLKRHQASGGGDPTRGQPIQCQPKPSAFLPCQDLFDTWWLRVGIWCVFLLAFTGNVLVIIVLSSVRQSSSTSALTSIMWLTHSKRHIDVPRFLVINLAIADLLMALYLGILALVDLNTLGEFKLFAIKWQYSNGCKLAGFLGVLSSELSVFILAIITLERNYAITNAVHLNRRLSLQKAMVIMFIGYTFAISMAIMPLNGISDYRKFSICLPLDMDSNLSSQLYVITLITINTFSFLLLLSCYLRMYCAIRGSQAWNANDLRIAKRMSILVITDFLCWMPIIVVAVASFLGYHLIGTNGIKILTIFILPLNSVANPFLYAITTKKFKRDLDTLIRRIKVKTSLDCANDQRDPKVFAGYNQYQHDLMMSKKRHLLLEGELNSRQADRLQRRRQCAQTLNQVTLNKTTCSCQKLNGLEVGSRNYQLQPVIVLDSAEPPTQPAPVGLKLSKKYPSTGTTCLRAEQAEAFENSAGSSGNKPAQTKSELVGTSKSVVSRLNSGHLLRPKSAETEIMARAGGPLNAHTSCQSILANNCSQISTDEAQGYPLNVEQSIADRSVSACGQRPSQPTTSRGTKVSCSCDISRYNQGETLSRSINRLFFNPIAKAWSSIQISLNSSATQIACHPIQSVQDDDKLAKSVRDGNNNLAQSTLIDGNTDLTPIASSKLRATSERRMSRSCDTIIRQQVHRLSLSSSDNEPTTSLGEHDDDQRILLATINRMKAGGCRNEDELPTNRQYLRSRCTRCRSWSPALLSKLEDCIHQIKCKIPGLANSRGESQLHEVIRRNEPANDGNAEIQSISSDGQETDDQTDQAYFDEKADSGEKSSEDTFNERGLLEWSEEREVMARRYRLRRQSNKLMRQSSTNSDTLSTRTGGTILTNMSVSFESNTNIPVVSQQQRDNYSDTRSELDRENGNDGEAV